MSTCINRRRWGVGCGVQHRRLQPAAYSCTRPAAGRAASCPSVPKPRFIKKPVEERQWRASSRSDPTSGQIWLGSPIAFHCGTFQQSPTVGGYDNGSQELQHHVLVPSSPLTTTQHHMADAGSIIDLHVHQIVPLGVPLFAFTGYLEPPSQFHRLTGSTVCVMMEGYLEQLHAWPTPPNSSTQQEVDSPLLSPRRVCNNNGIDKTFVVARTVTNR